jgi:hypothetical protein
VFLRDRSSGTLARVSVGLAGAEADGVSAPGQISADGRFVAFSSTAANLVPGDTDGNWDCFVVDLTQGTTELVSQGNMGEAVTLASISASGRFVAYWHSLTGGPWQNGDVFVRDRQLGTLETVSVGSSGEPSNGQPSYGGSVSADGSYVAFYGYAALVPADADMEPDVFVRDRDSDPSWAYCFGDGSGTACPCGNYGTLSNGCANSVEANGANLSASGQASLPVDTLVLLGIGMPNSSCLYFQGTSAISVVFGDGLRCVANSITRLGTQTNVAGASQYPAAGDAPISVRGNVTAPGTRTYQVWYRNAAAFCTAATFNLSNGVEVVWRP